MATAHTAEIAKRLSFGDITRNGAEESVLRDMTDIINASRNPSLDDVLK